MPWPAESLENKYDNYGNSVLLDNRAGQPALHGLRERLRRAVADERLWGLRPFGHRKRTALRWLRPNSRALQLDTLRRMRRTVRMQSVRKCGSEKQRPFFRRRRILLRGVYAAVQLLWETASERSAAAGAQPAWADKSALPIL